MRIALVTDVHVGPQASYDGKLRKLTHLAEPQLDKVAGLLRERFRPDLVINLGDAIEDESHPADRQNYRRFSEVLARCNRPLLHVAGNHDQVYLTHAELREFWQHSDRLFYTRDIGGFHFVVLRTDHEPTGVHLEQAQVEWLRADLARTHLPTLVLLHHPLCEQEVRDNRWFYNQPQIARVAERRRVREILKDSRKVWAVFNGHMHWNYLSVMDNIAYFTLQSLTENLDDDAPGRPSGAFALVDLGPTCMQVQVHGEQPLQFQIYPTRTG